MIKQHSYAAKRSRVHSRTIGGATPIGGGSAALSQTDLFSVQCDPSVVINLCAQLSAAINRSRWSRSLAPLQNAARLAACIGLGWDSGTTRRHCALLKNIVPLPISRLLSLHFPTRACCVLRVCAMLTPAPQVFAASGSIAAGQCGLDLLGCVAVGTITAVGGGTLRDVVVLRKEPFWSGADGEVEYIYLAVAGAVLAFVLYPLVGEHSWPDDMWPDAISLGAFGVIGAMNGVRAGLPTPLILVCGAMTGTGGGATRDIILKKPVRIFHSQKVHGRFSVFTCICV